ncbi:hypothetical protein CANCADRAFT_3717 [Tortispora caseinolytica NRRL Y-17796]|uniref:Rad21/Rec8-like protein N-terminal domain-containing protein n=1 Tax=Tortispora caseinolytica NRRL Y-17796 TaxID=767744 RepID=A0A1E4TBE4_9ASCO|nr:hypothetical protein CANCADRAFT_3717 [Tortispora caseinolytica NRRL Y-17796]
MADFGDSQGLLNKTWIAAQSIRKLNKHSILNIDLVEVIGVILENTHITVRTSGQLLLGVSRIQYRKSKYLLDECSEMMAQFRCAKRQENAEVLNKKNIELGKQEYTAAQKRRLKLIVPTPSLPYMDFFNPPPDNEDSIPPLSPARSISSIDESIGHDSYFDVLSDFSADDTIHRKRSASVASSIEIARGDEHEHMHRGSFSGTAGDDSIEQGRDAPTPAYSIDDDLPPLDLDYLNDDIVMDQEEPVLNLSPEPLQEISVSNIPAESTPKKKRTRKKPRNTLIPPCIDITTTAAPSKIRHRHDKLPLPALSLVRILPENPALAYYTGIFRLPRSAMAGKFNKRVFELTSPALQLTFSTAKFKLISSSTNDQASMHGLSHNDENIPEFSVSTPKGVDEYSFQLPDDEQEMPVDTPHEEALQEESEADMTDVGFINDFQADMEEPTIENYQQGEENDMVFKELSAGPKSFEDLTSGMSKKQASDRFLQMLVLATRGELRVEQSIPFGEIIVEVA